MYTFSPRLLCVFPLVLLPGAGKVPVTPAQVHQVGEPTITPRRMFDSLVSPRSQGLCCGLDIDPLSLPGSEAHFPILCGNGTWSWSF